ncbi:MAG: HAMP domain-containing protein [Spirochaetales bacterium]|nr:HAMP domain-containing protein [Spirochaetales bacterium]
MIILVLLFLGITERQIRTLVESDNEEQIQIIVRAFDQSIEVYLNDLNNTAGSATLVNAVMDPDNTGYYLPDFMEDMNIHNIPGDFLLLAFDGMVIYSTDTSYKMGENLPYFPELIDKTKNDNWIQFQDKDRNVVFVSDIKYNNLIEGYLIFNSSFSDIFKSNSYLFDLDGKDRFFCALYKDSILAGPEKLSQDSISSVFPLQTIPVSLQVSTSFSKIREPIKKIMYQILLVSSISILLLSVFFSVITSRNLIRPLLSLEDGIKQISIGNWENLKINVRDPIEIQFLSKSFNSMQESIRKKTLELETSNFELKKSNTDLISTQRQLVHSEKMASIGQLAAGVAHEINNPTGFVSTNLHTMVEYLSVYKNLFQQMEELITCIENKDVQEKSLTVINKIESMKEEENFPFILDDAFQLLEESIDGANRIKKIVLDLRNFARPESHDARLANINTAIEDALRLTSNELKYKCEIVKELGNLPDIFCRIDQITQVFVNLFVNAAHAIKDRGNITIKSWIETDSIFISVCDTGTGIDKENLDKLFDPFFTTKDVGEGTGLGLAISYGIIEKHGGTIEVESTPGKGSCFYINLPQKGNSI